MAIRKCPFISKEAFPEALTPFQVVGLYGQAEAGSSGSCGPPLFVASLRAVVGRVRSRPVLPPLHLVGALALRSGSVAAGPVGVLRCSICAGSSGFCGWPLSWALFLSW